MRLLVDAGNSRVKWAEFDGTRLDIGESFPTAAQTAAAQFHAHWAGRPAPRSVCLSNVAGPEWEKACIDWVRAAWDIDVQVVRSVAAAHGIVNAYATPSRLGVDRWVGMIGAKAVCGLPLCLVDCGTAVTVDLVGADGQHRGGWIAPGLPLMRSILADRLRLVAGVPDGEVAPWGGDTEECVACGTLAMVRGLVERALREARAALGEEPPLVLTGGDAAIIAAGVSTRYRVVQDLVLQGLARVAQDSNSAALRG
jgi:type III pantothenate kinase